MKMAKDMRWDGWMCLLSFNIKLYLYSSKRIELKVQKNYSSLNSDQLSDYRPRLYNCLELSALVSACAS
jgi:hypothetical protein